MVDLEDAIDQLADETGFSGVVRVDRDGARFSDVRGLRRSLPA
jgi:hypothetical protein